MSNLDETKLEIEIEKNIEITDDRQWNSNDGYTTIQKVEQHKLNSINDSSRDALNVCKHNTLGNDGVNDKPLENETYKALENEKLEKYALTKKPFENEALGEEAFANKAFENDTFGGEPFANDMAGKGVFGDEVGDGCLPAYIPQIPIHSRRLIEIGSETHITDDDLRLAATLVQEAMDGRRVELKKEPRFIRSYNRFQSRWLCGLLDIAVVVNICLVLCEEPAVPDLALAYWITMTMELLCLVYFTCRLSHQAYWRLWKDFKTDGRNILAAIILLVELSNYAIHCAINSTSLHALYGRNKFYFSITQEVTVADMVLYVVLRQYTSVTAIRWSRCLRPVLIMAFSDGSHLRKAWNNIRQTLHEIIHVILLFYFLIVVFSLVAMKMFQYRTDIQFPDGSPYFKDYLESYWHLYVLVTTSNNPDVMLPAYDGNRWYCLFFTVYIILCLYLMLNILLAVTYSSYRENMKKQIRNAAREKTRTLHEAFEVIKINNGGQEMVTYRTWSRLIKLAHPGKTNHQIDLLMLVLDTDKSGYISRKQFLSVADLLNVPVSEVGDRKTWMEVQLPAFYTSRPSELLKTIVDSM